jgi:endonuclease/exonuclease/phosphatase (EEP) superfamily protein YafD
MTMVLRGVSVTSSLLALVLMSCSASSENPQALAQTQVMRVMSLNIYGWATMPDSAPEYAALIEAQDVDVVGIQEGNWDWEIKGWPTDYSRSEQLHAALGECWERRYQIFVNTCRGATLDSHRRFDLTDGPRAVRTGETALVTKSATQFAFINIHWDHESAPARAASAIETAAEAARYRSTPTIVLGDFNCDCTSADVTTLRDLGVMALVVDGGIDCILARDIAGSGAAIDATPSDHPAVVATFTVGS